MEASQLTKQTMKRRIKDYFFLPFQALKTEWAEKKWRFIPFLEIFFVLSIPLSQYGLPLGNTGTWLIFLLAIIMLIRKKETYFVTPLALFIGYALFMLLLKWTITPNTKEVFHMVVSLLLYGGSLMVLLRYLDLRKLGITYFCISLVLSLGTVLHFFMIRFLGMEVRPIPLFISIGDPYSAMRLAAYSPRPLGFFFEPASYAGFAIWGILFGMRERRYLGSVYLLGTILMSASSYGVLVGGALLFVYATYLLYKTKHSVRNIFIELGVVVGVIAILFATPLGGQATAKIIAEFSGSGSMGPRVWAAFPIVANLSPAEFLFGTKYSSLLYLENSNTYMIPIQAYISYGYVNTWAQCVCYLGFVSLLFYLFMLVRCFRRCDNESKIVFVILIADTIATSAFLNHGGWMNLAFMYVLTLSNSDSDCYSIQFFPFCIKRMNRQRLKMHVYKI